MSGITPTAASLNQAPRASRHLVRRSAATLMWLLAGVGVLLRLTVCDCYQPWAIIFYATPVPILAVLMCIAGWAWGRSQMPLRRISLLCGALFIAWTIWSDCGFHKSPSNRDGIQLVVWNVAHSRCGLSSIAKQIRLWDLPLVALVEADTYKKSMAEQWRSELSGYDIAEAHFGGLLAVRGHILSKRWHSLSETSYCDQFDVLLGDDEFTVLLVDVASTIAASRRRPLERLALIAGELRQRPLVILGDFNTPDDSVWFEPLRQHCLSVFRTCGTGYGPTWPVPAPVLVLDQIWVNHRIDAKDCSTGWSWLSDHRPVFAKVLPRVDYNDGSDRPAL
jgi:vancomycin resistance protein VanJ